jgi:hypothetical protein
LAQAIAAKFKLNQSDVQSEITAYMQEQRGNWQQNMQQRRKNRLDQLVSQNKITSGQETLILSELTSLQNTYGPKTLAGMTQAQRQQAFQNEKNAITTWAAANGINPTFVFPFFGGHRGWNKTTPPPQS